MDLVVKGGQVVSPNGITSACIGIDDGKIVSIASEASLPSADRMIDATGKFVMPGVVDMHCHEDFAGKEEDGFAPWTKISRTEPMASALGGVTTVGYYLQPPGDQRITDFFDSYCKPFEANSILDGVFHIMTVNRQRLDDMELCCSQYGVTDFKFLVGYKGAQAASQGHAGIDDGFVFEGLEKVAALRKQGWPALALIHAENPDIIPYLAKSASKHYTVRAWHESRPNFVEEECVRRVIFLAGVVGCPILIVHTTIKEAMDYARRLQAEGVKIGEDVIIETCPQYLTHNHDNLTPLQNEKPVFTVVNPPIRTKEDNEGLWQGIKDGLVTVIGADVSPSTMKSKDVDMWKAPFVPMGVGNCSTFILPVMLSEGANKRGLSLEKVAEVTAYNPARYYSVYPQKGTISVGSDADLAIVDMNKEVVWDNARMSPSNADWSIYEGWKFKGWPVLTIVRGEVVMQDGEIVGKPGHGKYIPRHKVS
jgi:dihydropyrimidinase